MRYPSDLIESFGGVPRFVAAVNGRAGAGETLAPGAVYMWKSRGSVPYRWRPVVDAMRAAPETEAELASPAAASQSPDERRSPSGGACSEDAA